MTPTSLIAIPAYNCEKQIQRVICALDECAPLKNQIQKIIIFDNGSTDATVTQARKLIAEKKLSTWIEVFRNEKNYGLGGTHKVAFQYALDHQYARVLILHGDDQADVPDILKILQALDNGADAALGARFMKGSELRGYSKLRIFGNRALNLAYSFLSFKAVKDLGSGLNGFQTKIFSDQSFQEFSNQLTFNMDLLLDLLKKDRKIIFVPIVWKEEDQVSNAKVFQVGGKALKAVLLWRFGLSEKAPMEARRSLKVSDEAL